MLLPSDLILRGREAERQRGREAEKKILNGDQGSAQDPPLSGVPPSAR